MPLPSLARLALPATAVQFGPIDAETVVASEEEEGIKYTIELPEEWQIRLPQLPLQVVGRGSLATAVEAIRKPSDKVVVLVRPLDAHLPQEDDCPATRWSKDADRTEDTGWMEDCSVLSKKAYIEEMDGILHLMKTLGPAKLLPTLYDHGIVNGETTGIPGPPDAPWTQFAASKFGVQVWQQMTTTIAGYIRKSREQGKSYEEVRAHFVAVLRPKIETACAKLAKLRLHHYDLHLDNVAVDIDADGNMSDVVFLDPASIQAPWPPWRSYGQCQGQELVNRFDEAWRH